MLEYCEMQLRNEDSIGWNYPDPSGAQSPLNDEPCPLFQSGLGTPSRAEGKL